MFLKISTYYGHFHDLFFLYFSQFEERGPLKLSRIAYRRHFANDSPPGATYLGNGFVSFTLTIVNFHIFYSLNSRELLLKCKDQGRYISYKTVSMSIRYLSNLLKTATHQYAGSAKARVTNYNIYLLCDCVLF